MQKFSREAVRWNPKKHICLNCSLTYKRANPGMGPWYKAGVLSALMAESWL